ncbi:MAG: DJ-1/PfpI family protein [Candidatus Micrarchaeales archaeon]
MKVAILIAPRDFKDETVSNLQLLFAKKDIESVITGLTLKECRGYHGATIKPTAEARELEPMTYDVLLIADGPGVDSLKLYDHRPLLDLIKAFHDANRIVAGVNNGIKAIARANVIRDTKIAKPNDDETEKIARLYRGIIIDDYIVLDKNVLTLADSERIDELVNLLAKKASGT